MSQASKAASRRSAALPPVVSRRTTIFAAAGLVVAAVAVYANSFGGPFIFDDFLSIPQNPTLHSLRAALAPPGGGITVTGRPVLNFSFALNHALSGEQVWSYHALNLLIHLLAGLALFGIVRRTLARPGAGGAAGRFAAEAAGLAFFVALLWIVHPLQTESVTYIVQRAESLMGLFYLLTLYCFMRGAEVDRGGRWFAASFVSCLLGMGTKEVMVSAPVMVLLYDRAFLAGSFGAAWRRRGRVYLALGSTWIVLGALVLRAGGRGGSAGLGSGVGFWTYAMTQFQAIAHYLWLSVWPHPLILDYGVQWVKSAGEVVPYAVVVVPLVAATLVALVRWPRLGFLGFFFFAILAPTSLVPVARQTLADHRMYLALAPVLVLVILALRTGLGRRSWIILAAAAVGFGALTIRRNTDYRSSETIWSDTVAKRPGNAAAHNNYGNILAKSGRPDEALAQFEQAIQLDPGYTDAFFNAGNVLEQLGRRPEAIARYEQTLQLRPKDMEALDHLGLVLAEAGRLPEAIARFDQALRLDPDFAAAQRDLGRALATAGRVPEAITHLQAAVRSEPAAAATHNDLGMVLLMAGRSGEGIAEFEAALRLNPNLTQVHLNLAMALESVGRSREAALHYEEARRLGAGQPASLGK